MTIGIVQGLTQEPKQTNIVRLPDGKTVTISLSFSTLNSWFIGIQYDDFLLYNQRLVIGEITKQYNYALPFRLICVNTKDLGDPYFLEDFVSGRIYIQWDDEI